MRTGAVFCLLNANVAAGVANQVFNLNNLWHLEEHYEKNCVQPHYIS